MHLSFLSLGLHVPLCLIRILKSAKIEMSGCKDVQRFLCLNWGQYSALEEGIQKSFSVLELLEV